MMRSWDLSTHVLQSSPRCLGDNANEVTLTDMRAPPNQNKAQENAISVYFGKLYFMGKSSVSACSPGAKLAKG